MDDWTPRDNPYEILEAHNDALHDHEAAFNEVKEIINSHARMMEQTFEHLVQLHNVIEQLGEEVAYLKRQLDER